MQRKGVDIWRHLHPDEWCNPRARLVDAACVSYIVMSEDVVRRVKSAMILDRNPWSDHAPIAVEVT